MVITVCKRISSASLINVPRSDATQGFKYSPSIVIYIVTKYRLTIKTGVLIFFDLISLAIFLLA